MFVDEAKYLSFKYAWKKTLFNIFLLGFILLYILIMSRVRFRVNLRSIFAWMLRNSLLEMGAASTWVFLYEVSGCGLEFCSSH